MKLLLGRESMTAYLSASRIRPLDLGGNRSAENSRTMPLEVDKSVNWESIGGLDSHIHLVKEMVLLPLLYPQVRFVEMLFSREHCTVALSQTEF